MSNKVYSSYVTGGRAVTDATGVTRRPRRGAVVAVVDGTVLRVGWSLCNAKSGDRFNPELAKSLAEGRARTQYKFSLKFTKAKAPSISDLMQSGVPQSVLGTMGDVISEALNKNLDIRTIQIFNTQPKPTTTATPKPLWTVSV